MKKFLLTITLFISSFFFFNLENVKAADININLTEDSFSYINDDFLDFRNQVLEFVGTSKKYLIYYDSDKYKALIADNSSSYYIYFNAQRTSSYFSVSTFDVYTYTNGVLTFDYSITSNREIAVTNSSSDKLFYLDTNISNFKYSTQYVNYLNYNGNSYRLPNKSATLYNIYLENYVPPEPEDPYLEEKGILSNFYTCIIEKISYLANEFATNYIFLTILGIFVLIFIFELTRRYLM